MLKEVGASGQISLGKKYWRAPTQPGPAAEVHVERRDRRRLKRQAERLAPLV